MQLEVSGVKTFRGREGEGFNAWLHVNGVKACFVMDEATGGEYHFEWDPKYPDLEKQFYAYVDTLPEKHDVELNFTYKPNADIVVADLVNEFMNGKRFRRLCKTQTLFRVTGDPSGEYRVIKMAWGEKVKAYLDKKYPGKISEILNEKYGKAA